MIYSHEFGMHRYSLIIPFYNSRSLDRTDCLNSLLATVPDRDDLEIVLVDDHSDIPFRRRNDFRHAALTEVMNKERKKYAGSARNTGINFASGKYLIFADSDDLFDKEKFNDLLNARLVSDDDMVVARCTSFTEEGELGTRHLYLDKMIDKYIASSNLDDLLKFHVAWSRLYRRAFLVENQIYFSDAKVGEEMMFSTKLVLSQPKTSVFNHTIYAVREGNVSMTSEDTEDIFNIRMDLARQVQDLLRSSGRPDLITPMHYRLLRGLRKHPAAALRQLSMSLCRGDTIISPPKKMFRTILRRAL